jgi:hypothetical protein
MDRIFMSHKWEEPNIQKPKTEKNYTVFIWGFGQDHKKKPKTQTNLKVKNLNRDSTVYRIISAN